ncbi:MAG: bifunctional methionine sulfoxide reductase B/A protein [Deltaproteobacteria bacterium]|nr:bifunctional methionine sulfoxide reductase B/A protein [Deltaproteobacteria bacterium]MBN2671008.1 bifunctional methionine sulfoxide reductase B/A protein [Deltaproteobacteria bacterium]
MKKAALITIMLLAAAVFAMSLVAKEKPAKEMKYPQKYSELTEEEARVIVHKGTEAPFSGRFVSHKQDGTYTCKQCGEPLFSSDAKFDSKSGWPSFDDAIPGAVKEIPDADGVRTEIVCANCGAHLGHVFVGEGFTDKNTRHCVNSISLDFEPKEVDDSATQETAIFAGGCFWGVQYHLDKAKGVLSTTVGYIGGKTKQPSYEDVSHHNTGHVEAVKVVFDNRKTSFEKLAKLFFEIHDPTQVNRQGPDVGEQYKSVIFYTSDKQKEVAEKLIKKLKKKGFSVATELIPASTFWKAESYHQNYYEKKNQEPYCHAKVDRFQ